MLFGFVRDSLQPGYERSAEQVKVLHISMINFIITSYEHFETSGNNHVAMRRAVFGVHDTRILPIGPLK
jgi:hypothetical protein